MVYHDIHDIIFKIMNQQCKYLVAVAYCKRQANVIQDKSQQLTLQQEKSLLHIFD